MKRVPCLGAAPQALADFVAKHPQGTWKPKPDALHPAFKNEPGNHDVFEALSAAQGHLCAYCEIDIERGLKGQVEHFVPEHLADETWNCALDHTNLLACCEGGARLDIPNGRAEEPIRDTQHCGQLKGALDPRGVTLDPRIIPSAPSIWTFVNYSGEIGVNEGACKAAGIDAEVARRTIKQLGLDRSGLRRMRLAVLEGLDGELYDIVNTGQDLAAAIAQIAQEQFLPKQGRLPKFWSTIRHWAGDAAEQLLTQRAEEIPGMK